MTAITQTIKKAIDIRAPKEKVWEVLLHDKFTRIWYAAFSEGTYAQTDWQEGSKAVFMDNSGNGMVGRVITHLPYEKLSLEFDGVVNAGKEDVESLGAKQVKGTHETYQLQEKEGISRLIIESDMAEEYMEGMSAAWDRALQKVKDLAEQA